MKTVLHPGLTSERWQAQPFSTQLLHIYSELTRARKWILRQDYKLSDASIERALELIDLTSGGPHRPTRLREILRFREAIAEYWSPVTTDDREFANLLRQLLAMSAETWKLGIAIEAS